MDNVTKVKGNHSFKGGIQFDRLYGIVLQPPWGRGQFTYNGQYSDVVNANTNLLGLADMLLTPTAATVPNGISNLSSMSNFQASNVAPNRDIRYYYGAYFQDDWKVTPTLTVNLGLRWDHFTPYQEINGRQANFIQSGNGNGPTGTYYIPNEGCAVPRAPSFDALLASSGISLFCTSNKETGNAQIMNFAPRIGFADRITPNAGDSRRIWNCIWSAFQHWIRGKYWRQLSVPLHEHLQQCQQLYAVYSIIRGNAMPCWRQH